MGTQHPGYTLAAGAETPLADVCRSLEAALGTPPFDLDGHSSWEYATVTAGDFCLNVTKYWDDPRSNWWFDKAPPGCNYQVILMCSERKVGELMPRLRSALEKALRTEVHELC